ncbi:MAG: hypothetical protein SFY69_05495 [Planctomycetota bacterium]|nr:hypothetical protein [Planctomycetota bacterium]
MGRETRARDQDDGEKKGRRAMTAPARGPKGAGALSAGQGYAMEQLLRTRELFWHNVVQEILTGLSVLHAKRTSGDSAGADVFDGRIAVITAHGARVPIGAVYPLFACAVSTSEQERALSTAVECTVFQIETPEGHAFTLPLHEIRAVHALSAELMERIKGASSDSASPEEAREEMPFGFAAFTSLARSRREGAGVPGPLIVGPGLAE